VPPLPAKGWLRRLWSRITTAARWREIGYLLLLFPLGTLSFTTIVTVWSGSAALLGLPFYVQALPEESAKFWFFDLTFGGGAIAAAIVGLLGLLLLAPWTTVAIGRLNLAAARRLLSRPTEQIAEERAQVAESQRVAAVDSAEAERRRIERDLHDGTQARLTALAMDLGRARERMDVDPDGARQLVAEAHEEVKATIKELRDLVRGIHPAILEDRGLDAALSAVVARSPIPVRLDVDLHARLDPSVESTAYFVVSEALANVAKHSGASTASVSIARRADRLVIEIRDDGEGGADATKGTGLRGLHDRVTALGGWMQVVSPAGGPTTLFVEVPCGS
jgi:signal transduction histidine kinase